MSMDPENPQCLFGASALAASDSPGIWTWTPGRFRAAAAACACEISTSQLTADCAPITFISTVHTSRLPVRHSAYSFRFDCINKSTLLKLHSDPRLNHAVECAIPDSVTLNAHSPSTDSVPRASLPALYFIAPDVGQYGFYHYSRPDERIPRHPYANSEAPVRH